MNGPRRARALAGLTATSLWLESKAPGREPKQRLRARRANSHLAIPCDTRLTATRSMLASIVISTYNRAAALPSTLDALRRQDVPATDFEVLVIDDGSTNATPDVLRSVSVAF